MVDTILAYLVTGWWIIALIALVLVLIGYWD